MAKNEKKNDISNLSFEQAIKELTGIVNKIEQGQVPLQDSLEQYEKGMGLIKHCKEILKKAEDRIEKISEQQNTGDRIQETEYKDQKAGERRQEKQDRFPPSRE
jgi:exodeoxyribonuclease VII small subunit